MNPANKINSLFVRYPSLFVATGYLLLVQTALTAQASPQREIQPTATAEKIAKQAINEKSLRADIKFLADDLLEGRGPGTRGDLLAQNYIVSQFELAGLKPAGQDGSYIQTVPLVGVTTKPPARLSFDTPSGDLDFKNSDDYILTCGQPVETVDVSDADMVFVGYGMQAPEYEWDDFKDVDVKGKILLVLNNDLESDPELFAGRTRLYYGRWDYKYAKAAEMGAIGALIIHTTPSAGYPWQVIQTSWTGEQMALGGVSQGRLPVEGWLTDEAAAKLVAASGLDLEKLRQAALQKNFQPVDLKSQLSLHMDCRVRERTTGNVLGLLPGTDPELSKQWVVYTAHHDHIGLSDTRDERGDNIYNGAIDNASGVAVMLGIMRSFARLPESMQPKRSILFASVGAEEQGLLGSEYLAANPPVPVGNLAAVINIDGVNILGPTHDVVVIGRGKSDMDKAVDALAGWQGRVVVGDQFPDRGYYYRSDQFSLAKVGVPGVYLGSGTHVVGKPQEWGPQQLREWTENVYHQTSDEYREDWNLGGALQDARLMFHLGLETANQPNLPAWNPGDEFEAARMKALNSKN